METAIETESDKAEIEYLYDLSFAPGREMLSSYRLRDNLEPVSELCYVMRDEYHCLAAVIRYWPVRIGSSKAPALLLGPIAVHPIRQGEGLGAYLMSQTLLKAAEIGWKRVILVGDLPYYARFGFEPAADFLKFPKPNNPARVLAKALVPDAFNTISGAVRHWKE